MPWEVFVFSDSMRGDAGPQCFICLRERNAPWHLLPEILIPSWLPGEFAKILRIWISTMCIYIYIYICIEREREIYVIEVMSFNVCFNTHTMYVCIVVVYINTINGLRPLEQPRRALHPDRTTTRKTKT